MLFHLSGCATLCLTIQIVVFFLGYFGKKKEKKGYFEKDAPLYIPINTNRTLLSAYL